MLCEQVNCGVKGVVFVPLSTANVERPGVLLLCGLHYKNWTKRLSATKKSTTINDTRWKEKRARK